MGGHSNHVRGWGVLYSIWGYSIVVERDLPSALRVEEEAVEGFPEEVSCELGFGKRLDPQEHSLVREVGRKAWNVA